jgi:glutaredoxin
VELARYGEADAVLTGFSGAPSPEILELIAFVAAKKGEYRRAETASRAALEINPEYAPSLLHLGWSRAAGGRWEEVKEILERLDDLELNEEMSGGRDDLAARMEEATTRFVACASCGTEWRVRKNPDPVPPIRLYAMPPDDMPAGICPACGKSYCVGCRKDALDEAGRFTCPECGKTLKLSDEGVKELVYIWAEENIAREKKKQKKKSKPAGELSVPVTEPEVPKNSVSPSAEPSVSGPMDGEQTSAEPEHGGQVVAGTAPGGEAAGPEVVPPQPESVALPAAGPLPVAENNTPLSTEASASGPENGEVTGQPAL